MHADRLFRLVAHRDWVLSPRTSRKRQQAKSQISRTSRASNLDLARPQIVGIDSWLCARFWAEHLALRISAEIQHGLLKPRTAAKRLHRKGSFKTHPSISWRSGSVAIGPDIESELAQRGRSAAGLQRETGTRSRLPFTRPATKIRPTAIGSLSTSVNLIPILQKMAPNGSIRYARQATTVCSSSNNTR